MYKKQIEHVQAQFGKNTAGKLIGTNPEIACQIGMPIRVRKGLTIDLQISPVFVKGKRKCVVEAWMMQEYGVDYANSVNYISAGPYPVETPMSELVPIAYGLVPTLKAHHEVLPSFSSQMLEMLRKYKPAAELVAYIDQEIAAKLRELKK